MFVFGHIGVTLGIAFVISRLVLPRLRGGIRPNLNYSFITLGAILPDLIDKPIGRILLGESIANGRRFGHTLLFVLILVHFSFLQKTFLQAKTFTKNISFFGKAFFSKERFVLKEKNNSFFGKFSCDIHP